MSWILFLNISLISNSFILKLVNLSFLNLSNSFFSTKCDYNCLKINIWWYLPLLCGLNQDTVLNQLLKLLHPNPFHLEMNIFFCCWKVHKKKRSNKWDALQPAGFSFLTRDMAKQRHGPPFKLLRVYALGKKPNTSLWQ